MHLQFNLDTRSSFHYQYMFFYRVESISMLNLQYYSDEAVDILFTD